MEEKIYCSHCGELIDTDDYGELDGEILCSDCLDDYTTVCDCCSVRIWSEDAEGDDYTSLCRQCYDYHYTRCEECDVLIHNDDAYEYDDGYFCHECYQKIRRNAAIHEYGYKPTPIFYCNMPAVILAVILGTVIGLMIHLGKLTQKMGMGMEKIISKVIPGQRKKDEGYSNVLVTAIVLFCASGTGIYGSITAGMTGDHSILLAKTVLDFATALIFACNLEMVTCVIAIPQFIIFMILFLLAGAIYPLCTETMICDFKACGGVLLVATGFRMMKVKEFPIADMIPAMVLVMPLSHLWTTYVLPFIS